METIVKAGEIWEAKEFPLIKVKIVQIIKLVNKGYELRVAYEPFEFDKWVDRIGFIDTLLFSNAEIKAMNRTEQEFLEIYKPSNIRGDEYTIKTSRTFYGT